MRYFASTKRFTALAHSGQTMDVRVISCGILFCRSRVYKAPRRLLSAIKRRHGKFTGVQDSCLIEYLIHLAYMYMYVLILITV